MSDRPLLLTGLLVLECTATVAGAYCGKLLADLGADVIKIEPPAGDPLRWRGPFPGDVAHAERSGLHLYLNTNKRGQLLDLEDAADTDVLDPLLCGAHLLIEDFQAGRPRPAALDPRRLSNLNPRLVTVSVTHFGRTGPYHDWHGSGLVDFHMSGLGYLTPGNVVDVREPPLKVPGVMAEQVAGLTAAVAGLAAVILADRTGQAHGVDVAALEASAAMLIIHVPWLPYEGKVPSRLRAEARGIPVELLPCADGYFTVLTVEAPQWRAWVELLGNPDWAADPALEDRNVRAARWDTIKQGIIDWARNRGKGDIAAQGQARAVPVFPVNTTADLFACPQLAARGFLTPIDHPVAGRLLYPGLPYQFTGVPMGSWSPAPLLRNADAPASFARAAPATDEAPYGGTPARPAPHAGTSLPLDGVRVADFSWIIAGPRCTTWLGALGADVIRVETHRRLDQFRRSPPYAEGVVNPERSGSYHTINFAKRSVTLDLTRPEAQAYARELIAVSDIVIENFAAGQMERFGLGLDSVRAIRPDAIMASSSGVGRTGPMSGYVAYGNTIHAYAGLSALVGHPGEPPRGIPSTYTDPLTGATQCFAILAALRYRARTGQGCTIDLSMAEATLALLPEALLDYAMNGRVAYPQGNRDPQHAPHGVYPCAGEDRWVAIAVDSEAAWRRFCAALGKETWRNDARFVTARERIRHRDELDRAIAAWTACRSPEEVTATLQRAGVSAGPSNTVADLLADPHLRERGFFIAPEHPLTGARLLPGLPWHFTPDLPTNLRPAPLLGQHNAEVFGDLFGLSPAALDQLIEAKVAW